MWGLLSPLRIHVYLFRTTEAETIILASYILMHID
jgi:hypothetical protein